MPDEREGCVLVIVPATNGWIVRKFDDGDFDTDCYEDEGCAVAGSDKGLIEVLGDMLFPSKDKTPAL